MVARWIVSLVHFRPEAHLPPKESGAIDRRFLTFEVLGRELQTELQSRFIDIHISFRMTGLPVADVLKAVHSAREAAVSTRLQSMQPAKGHPQGARARRLVRAISGTSPRATGFHCQRAGTSPRATGFH